MAVVWLGLEHPLNEFTLLDSLLDLFGAHKEDTCLLVNSPLWFILALINLQLITYALKFTLRRRWLIMLVALGISALGIWHMEHRDTYFMFGRSLRYLGYYVFGHLYGKQLLGIIERDLKSRLTLWGVALTLLAAGAIGTFGGFAGREAWTYLFNSALVVSLIVLFRYVCRVPALRFFHFYGRNSYAVLGIHYMLIQTIYLILIPAFGMPSPAKGVLILLFVLLTMVPVINGFNRYAPQLVGKKPAIPFPILQRA